MDPIVHSIAVGVVLFLAVFGAAAIVGWLFETVANWTDRRDAARRNHARRMRGR
jgi:hypothetical protein